jgi:hypothetical protein
MILIDTSVWVDHLRVQDVRMRPLLEEGQVLMHAVILGEIALGMLARRAEILSYLTGLPRILPARDSDVLALIETAQLAGSGIGWADAHLIAAVLVRPGSRLWTRDRRMLRLADRKAFADIVIAAP